MRVAVLSTDTGHHRWFLRELVAKTGPNVEIVLALLETRAYPWARNAARHRAEHRGRPLQGWLLNPYVQPALLSRLQDRFERPRFFPGGDDSLPVGLPVVTVASVNDDGATAAIDSAMVDLLFVYGTGLVKPHVFTRTPRGAINAHGGLLPGYRGLDTNLWSALRGRADEMAVTLHQMDATFDTGDIYLSRPLPRASDLRLRSLRYHTTVVCTQMAIDLLGALADGTATPTKQDGSGEYFRPMPFVTKLRARRALRRHASEKSTR